MVPLWQENGMKNGQTIRVSGSGASTWEHFPQTFLQTETDLAIEQWARVVITAHPRLSGSCFHLLTDWMVSGFNLGNWKEKKEATWKKYLVLKLGEQSRAAGTWDVPLSERGRYTEGEELKGHGANALDTEDYRHQGQGDRSSNCGKHQRASGRRVP